MSKKDLLLGCIDPSVSVTESDHLARIAEKGQGAPFHKRPVIRSAHWGYVQSVVSVQGRGAGRHGYWSSFGGSL